MSLRSAANPGVEGVILAGGRSRRMGGRTKALLPLNGIPLLRHVIDRVNPQVARLMLSVARVSEAFEEFGLPLVEDPRPDGGPLGGVLSALQHVDPVHDWLFLVPCDAPFVPTDLAAGLLVSALAADRPAAVICCDSQIQPTFSIWNRRLLPHLEEAVLVEGMAGIKQFLRVTEHAQLEWPCSIPPPFFNINDQDGLLEASNLARATGL